MVDDRVFDGPGSNHVRANIIAAARKRRCSSAPVNQRFGLQLLAGFHKTFKFGRSGSKP